MPGCKIGRNGGSIVPLHASSLYGPMGHCMIVIRLSARRYDACVTRGRETAIAVPTHLTGDHSGASSIKRFNLIMSGLFQVLVLVSGTITVEHASESTSRTGGSSRCEDALTRMVARPCIRRCGLWKRIPRTRCNQLQFIHRSHR